MPPRKDKRRKGAAPSESATPGGASPPNRMDIDGEAPSFLGSPVAALGASMAAVASPVGAPEAVASEPPSSVAPISAAVLPGVDAADFIQRVEAASASLHQRLDDVSRLRTTEAEASIAAMTAAWQSKSAAQDALIQSLRAEVARLNAEQEDCGFVPVGAVRASAVFQASEAAATALRAENATLTATAASLAAEVAALRAAAEAGKAAALQATQNAAVLRVFRLLTALDVAPAEAAEAAAGAGTLAAAACSSDDASAAAPAQGQRFRCSTTDPATGTAVTFLLDIIEPPPSSSDGEVEVEYAPLGPGAAACLPAFLHEPISFSAAQAPMFMAKVAQALHEDDGDEGEEGEAAGAEASAAAPAPTPALAGAAAPAAAAAPSTPATPVAPPQSPLRPASAGAAAASTAMDDGEEGEGVQAAPASAAQQQQPVPESRRRSARLSRRRSAGGGGSASATRRVSPEGLVFRSLRKPAGGSRLGLALAAAAAAASSTLAAAAAPLPMQPLVAAGNERSLPTPQAARKGPVAEEAGVAVQ